MLFLKHLSTAKVKLINIQDATHKTGLDIHNARVAFDLLEKLAGNQCPDIPRIFNPHQVLVPPAFSETFEKHCLCKND